MKGLLFVCRESLLDARPCKAHLAHAREQVCSKALAGLQLTC